MITEKGERTRQHFIKTSAVLFNLKGYSGTSISDILNTSGYSKGALYRIFNDKDELSIEAFKFNLSVIQKALNEIVLKEKTAIEKLLAIPRFYRNNLLDKIMLGGCPILNTSIEADDTHEELNSLVNSAFSQWNTSIEKIIESGQETGEFKNSLKAKEISNYMIAVIEGTIAMSKSFKDRNLMRTNMTLLEQYLLQIV
nr:TetR/AcrR family transcriptional regulator [uncultured Allomuricauda sp.]|tara:strand:+ start:2114 stop:2707 length:594 start_codon:yes stop_codon:yes gene_type:complete